ncbi:hypothetical protein [Paracoccus sp. SM22M-07]|uniref:hypothetical protein n=1 Tax=Paracoccus sp. SM22M-07 TaxID=1520813 RepID=UPI00093017B6|nr:hypothetical protein [Paracoccus sp. SM22M-07]
MSILSWWFTNFRQRRLEWCIALYTVGFGAFLMLPFVSFATAGYRGVLTLMSEFSWGLVYLLTGILHNVALHVNGRAAWTPFARVVTLFLNSQVFLAFALAFAHSNPAGSGVFTYAVIATLFCWVALWAAGEDCGREYKIWKEGRRHA